MFTPFGTAPREVADEELVEHARLDDREALEALLARHQPWVFNIALRMLSHHADAEDATQEILLKVVRALPSFRGESKLSTWLYPIAVNHLLNVRKKDWRASEAVCPFVEASAGLQRVPDLDPPDPDTISVPMEVLVEEVKVSCMMGTLLCLGVGDVVGAEIVGVTPASFRQILSRARRDLYEYLRGNRGLVDPTNSCGCARETRAYVEAGVVDPGALRFAAGHLRRTRDVVERRWEELTEACMRAAEEIYQGHPFCEPAEGAQQLRRVIESPMSPAKILGDPS